MGPSTVAPSGSGAQAPSPSFTEGTYAVSGFLDLTDRTLAQNRHRGCAAAYRRAPPRYLRVDAGLVARLHLARADRAAALDRDARPRASHRRRLQGRQGVEPVHHRRAARRGLSGVHAGRRQLRLERCRTADGRPRHADALRAAPSEHLGDAAATEDRPHRLPLADSPLHRCRGENPVRRPGLG